MGRSGNHVWGQIQNTIERYYSLKRDPLAISVSYQWKVRCIENLNEKIITLSFRLLKGANKHPLHPRCCARGSRKLRTSRTGPAPSRRSAPQHTVLSVLCSHCSLCSTTRNSIVLRTGRVIHRRGVSGPACLWWSDTRCLRSRIAQTRQSLGGRLVKYRILWPSRIETYIPIKHMNIPQTLNQNVQISFHIMNCPTRWYIKSRPNQIGADHVDVWRKWFCPKYSEILKS